MAENKEEVKAPEENLASENPPPTTEMVLCEVREKVALVTLNRPKALNALCDQLIDDLYTCVMWADRNPNIGAVVLTGSEKAFAAGADIKEMKDKDSNQAYQTRMLEKWQNLRHCKVPIIAAVNGFALGGGCELALLCDIIYAGVTRAENRVWEFYCKLRDI